MPQASELNPNEMPTHIAVIMDGNGRWAQTRGLSRLRGHAQGVEALRRVVQTCLDLKIPYLTVFAFSTENWARPAAEVRGLMTLLKKQLGDNLDQLHKLGVRIRVVGEREGLDPSVLSVINHAVDHTTENQGLTLQIAFNYGGRADITQAARLLATQVQQGKIDPQNITEESLNTALWTAGIPDPDLLIRTSGLARISNFLMWQLAYTELVFIDPYWPDIQKDDILNAIKNYQQRDRRFGKATGQQ